MDVVELASEKKNDTQLNSLCGLPDYLREVKRQGITWED